MSAGDTSDIERARRDKEWAARRRRLDEEFAQQHHRLTDALGKLGADHEPPAGWEQRVLAASTRRRRVSIAVLAALLVVLAVAIARLEVR